MVEPYITPAEAAAHVGIKPRLLLRSDAPRYALGHRTIRFRLSELDAWMASKREGRTIPNPPRPTRSPARLPERDREFEETVARWQI